jgi:peptidoglycan/xylan/chitin deacetylase (PgdA/CDA1 family)
MALHRRGRRALWLAALAAALLASGTAVAGEVLVESLEGESRFAPLWPGGTFDQGREADLPWLRVVTDGKGGGTFISNVRPYHPLIDFRGKFVKVWTKIDDLSRLSGMEFRLSSDRFSNSYYAFTFSRYDDEDTNIVRAGEWNILTFSFGSARVQGEPDRSAINSIGWYVADKGGDAPVTAYWAGMAAVDEPSEGVLTMTFDDGYDEHHKAAQLMAPYGFRGTAYVIPDVIGQFGYMTLHQLVDLQEKYGWEVAAHHEKPFTEMPPDQLEDVLLGLKRYLIENQFFTGAEHLAYPLGKQNTSLVRPLVRKHFTTARVVATGPETLPPADPYMLRIMNVTNETKPEDVARALREAVEYKEWLILMFHYMVEKPSISTEYSLADFQAVLKQIQKSGIRVLPLAEVWDACGRIPSSVVGLGCQVDKAVAALRQRPAGPMPASAASR